MSFPSLPSTVERGDRKAIHFPPSPAGEPVGSPLLRLPLRRRREEGGTPVPRSGYVYRVWVGGAWVVSLKGAAATSGWCFPQIRSLSGHGPWGGGGGLVGVVSCHPFWLVRLGFARPSRAVASCVFLVGGVEATAMLLAEVFVSPLSSSDRKSTRLNSSHPV